jgi:hypothetical protein
MARGIARAPSQSAYRGSIGRTQTATVHVTGSRGDLIAATVYTTIDAVSDPELVERLHSEDPGRALNVIRTDAGDTIHIAVPVVYHDPAAEVMVLVLGEAHRHREIDERIRLYERLRDDDEVIPAYAKEFAVVFGAPGLRSYLEKRAQEALDTARSAEATRDVDRRRADLAAREAEIDRKLRELERARAEVDAAKSEVANRVVDIERQRAEVEQLKSEARNRVIASAAKPAEAPEKRPAFVSEHEALTVVGPPPSGDEVRTSPVQLHDDSQSDILTAIQPAAPVLPPSQAPALPGRAAMRSVAEIQSTNGHNPHSTEISIEFGDEEETTGSSIVPQGSDPLTTETQELPAIPNDAWLDQAIARQASACAVDNGKVRIAIVVDEQVARGLGGLVDVRVLLHRTASYPVVTLVFGPPAALRVPSPTQLAIIALDPGTEPDRGVLLTLARGFELHVQVITRGACIRRMQLIAPLADNVGFIIRAADDHLRGVAAVSPPSFARGVDEVGTDSYDLLGMTHPELNEFRDDKLAQIETAQHLRRAIAVARRFQRSAREDYLVCTRGFPLTRWRELRHHVLESAVTWGMWPGPELAQIAVAEGLARSRRDLVVRLEKGFEALRRHPTAFDIDNDAAEDNMKAIGDEARAQGVELERPKNGAWASDETSVVSGSIDGPPQAAPPKSHSIEELIALLEDRKQRVAVAIELCERGDGRAAAPVVNAVKKMSRAEAVRVLGMCVRFGNAAAQPLAEGLGSSKAFLRHGCALALALLRTEEGTQSVIDLLLSEPTEIWREVARAIGQVGPPALMPLASNFGRLGARATPAMSERVAWAMAHVGVRGGKAAIEQMAHGQSVVAPVAKHALELLSSAANDHVRVRQGADGSQGGKEVTVNRAFSRRFFEAVEQGIPSAGQPGLVDLEASGPMELLDEADLIEDEEEAELDESDLIQQ